MKAVVHLKKVIVLTILCCLICPVCFAKIFSSSDGRVTINTPAGWEYFSPSCASDVQDVLTVARNDGLGMVSFTRSINGLQYQSFRDMGYDLKCRFRNTVVQLEIQNRQAQGYDTRVSKSDVFDQGVSVVYNTFRNGVKVITQLDLYYIRNYILYQVSFMAANATLEETTEVFKSLTIDGVPYGEWSQR